MSAEAIEVEEPTEPLRLSCGHLLSAVVTSTEGTSYCGACAELAEPIQAEAIEENDQPADRPIEEPVLTSAEIEPGGPQEESHAQTQAGDEEPAAGLVSQPYHSVRGTEPGARGCWAISIRTQKPCGAPNVRGEHYCSAHLGRGVAKDPSRYSPQGIEARKRNSAIRSEVKLMYGSSRSGSARHVLRAAVEREAIPLVGRAVGAALSREVDDAKAAGIALRLIESAEPRDQASVTLEGELTPEGIDSLSFSQLLALAEKYDTHPPR